MAASEETLEQILLDFLKEDDDGNVNLTKALDRINTYINKVADVELPGAVEITELKKAMRLQNGETEPLPEQILTYPNIYRDGFIDGFFYHSNKVKQSLLGKGK